MPQTCENCGCTYRNDADTVCDICGAPRPKAASAVVSPQPAAHRPVSRAAGRQRDADPSGTPRQMAETPPRRRLPRWAIVAAAALVVLIVVIVVIVVASGQDMRDIDKLVEKMEQSTIAQNYEDFLSCFVPTAQADEEALAALSEVFEVFRQEGGVKLKLVRASIKGRLAEAAVTVEFKEEPPSDTKVKFSQVGGAWYFSDETLALFQQLVAGEELPEAPTEARTTTDARTTTSEEDNGFAPPIIPAGEDETLPAYVPETTRRTTSENTTSSKTTEKTTTEDTSATEPTGNAEDDPSTSEEQPTGATDPADITENTGETTPASTTGFFVEEVTGDAPTAP